MSVLPAPGSLDGRHGVAVTRAPLAATIFRFVWIDFDVFPLARASVAPSIAAPAKNEDHGA